MPDGYLDYFNQRWLQYVGLPIEDLLGWKWTAVIHPEDVGAIVEKWHFSIANGEPFLHEARVRRANGEYRWMLPQSSRARRIRPNCQVVWIEYRSDFHALPSCSNVG